MSSMELDIYPAPGSCIASTIDTAHMRRTQGSICYRLALSTD